MLTSCHSEGNKEVMNVRSIGTQHPAERVHKPPDDGGQAAATGVNEQTDERPCHRTQTKGLTKGVLFSRLLSKSSCEDKEENIRAAA